MKKSLALVKNDGGEVGKGIDKEEKVGSKKKSVSFQHKRKMEGYGRAGKKKKKQRKVGSTTPTTTEGNSIPSILNVS